MALTQVQIIQSLGEALSWLQREIDWGANIAELRHLTGRIGELYAALITNGRMAEKSLQAGYDVVSSDGERISVKTTSMSYGSGHVSFNPRTLVIVDRIIVLQISTEDDAGEQDLQIKVLLNAPTHEAVSLMGDECNGKRALSLSKLLGVKPPPKPSRALVEVIFDDLRIQELETGTIVLLRNGVPVQPVKPVLRDIAQKLSIGILNAAANPLNTRQLGSQVIRSIQELSSESNPGRGVSRPVGSCDEF